MVFKVFNSSDVVWSQLIANITTCTYIIYFIDEWKELTAKLSKANTAKCEAQAKLSDIQSTMVTLEVC